MPMPRSITRVNRNGVRFTSNVNRAEYTLTELTRAALRDIGKVITFKAIAEVKKIADGKLIVWNKKYKEFQYWNRQRETDLQVGIKHETWFGVDQELGLNGQPKRDILRKAVFENLQTIREIQAKYLKHIEDEMTAQRMIDENAEVADDD
jgi:hypothetical protein